MFDIDSDGLIKVEVNGAVHRRPAHVGVVVRDHLGAPVAHRAVPELRAGEMLMERIGMMPVIIRTGL